MSRFTPRLDILPRAQRLLWPDLEPTVGLDFVLYGGTAVAVRLAHRVSVDFDLFTDRPLDQNAIRAALPCLARASTLQDRWDVLTLLVPVGDDGAVKISFFGGIDFGRVGRPDMTDDGILQVASIDDLMATKVKVVLQRAEAKDYRDIAAMIRAGADLPKALAAARAMFRPTFQPSETLKALAYFADGDLSTLANEDRDVLLAAVTEVRDLPRVDIVSARLTG